jgi:hypothetical protein
MDPSHARRYEKPEIEVRVARTLKEAYPDCVTIPIDIDLLIECHPRIDRIVPIPELETKFAIAAVLIVKTDGRFDILVDEETLDYQRSRASFSIAHELGHIVLHSEVFVGCKTVEDSIALGGRVKRAYRFLEEAANYFAAAVLIPHKQILSDAAKLYEFLVKGGNYETRLDQDHVSATLARRYGVNPTPMKIRLEQLGITKKIQRSLLYRSPFLELG